MNILVTGVNSQLGRSIRFLVETNNVSADNFFFTSLHPENGDLKLGITDEDDVREIMQACKPDIIINCAAYTNVEDAQDKGYGQAFLVNRDGTRNLANAAKEYDALLINISTDYVFGGMSNVPYIEEIEGTPVNVYGQSKMAGERVIKESGCHYINIRTSWLYSEFGHNFLKSILNAIRTKDYFKVVSDQVGTPTYAMDLAAVILRIINTLKFSSAYKGFYDGTYHYSNEGVASWYDFAEAILFFRGSGSHVNIIPCRTDEYPQKAERPPYSVLDKSKIKKTFKLDIPHWTEGVFKCLHNLREF